MTPKGTLYIGQTKNYHRRMCDHCNFAKRRYKNKWKYKTKLYNAIRKYKWKNINLAILEKHDNKNPCIKYILNEREKFFIKKFGTFENKIWGLNHTEGGGGSRGYKWSNEMRKRLKKTMNTPEYQAKISAARQGNKNCVGRVLSKETKSKISASLKGKKSYVRSKETLAKQSANSAMSKPIIGRDTNGVETEYMSIREAAKTIKSDTKLKSLEATISQRVHEGSAKPYYNIIWRLKKPK